MAHVVTDLCTKCMNCTTICPVTCIHPCANEAGVETVPQVYVNPDECINCGQCAAECPSTAIFAEEELPPDKQKFKQVNADYYKK
ncbi:MAG: ferredoxin family protein [Phycisphaerae bacterium]